MMQPATKKAAHDGNRDKCTITFTWRSRSGCDVNRDIEMNIFNDNDDENMRTLPELRSLQGRHTTSVTSPLTVAYGNVFPSWNILATVNLENIKIRFYCY